MIEWLYELFGGGEKWSGWFCRQCGWNRRFPNSISKYFSMREPDSGRDERRKHIQELNPLSCAELLQQTVFDLSTKFGRLLQSAAKLNEEPDRYRDASGWSHSTSDENLQRIARRDGHRLAFDDWLSLNIARQLTDVNNFLALQNEEQRRLILKWLEAGRYTQLPPSNTWAPDLDLFLNDMNVVVLLLQAAE